MPDQAKAEKPGAWDKLLMHHYTKGTAMGKSGNERRRPCDHATALALLFPGPGHTMQYVFASSERMVQFIKPPSRLWARTLCCAHKHWKADDEVMHEPCG
jgi:hypothetical protein